MSINGVYFYFYFTTMQNTTFRGIRMKFVKKGEKRKFILPTFVRWLFNVCYFHWNEITLQFIYFQFLLYLFYFWFSMYFRLSRLLLRLTTVTYSYLFLDLTHFPFLLLPQSSLTMSKFFIFCSFPKTKIT